MNPDEIFDACRKGEGDLVRQIVSQYPHSVNAEDHRGFTPLILAAYNNNIVIAEILLANGAESDKQDGAGNTALMGVSFKGYTELAIKLIEAGADVNFRNLNGATALTFAATFGHLAIAEILLRSGADVTLCDTRGKSPLDHAIIQENEPMAQLINGYTNTLPED